MFLIKMKQLTKKKKRAQLKEFPFIVNNKNRILLALKFFLNKKKKKNEMKIYKKLVLDLLSAVNKSSTNKRKSLYEYAYLKKKYFFYR